MSHRIIRTFKGLLSLAVIGGVIWSLGVAFSWGLSHTDGFCGTCHYVEPFIDEWQHSEHAEVPCWKCHNRTSFGDAYRQHSQNLLNGIKYVTGTFDYIPRAEVVDEACQQKGCHPDSELEKPVEWTRGIQFDHRGHRDGKSRGIDLRCVSCHSRIVRDKHMTVTRESCYLCHFKDMPKGVAVAGCKCHGTPERRVDHKGFTVDHEQFTAVGMLCADCHLDVTRGNGDVKEQHCHQCHLQRDVAEYDRSAIHGIHAAEHDISCDSCHDPIEHEQVEMVNTLEVSCAGCHERTHSPQLDMYMGVGAKGVDPLSDVMFKAQVGCDGCHRDRRQGPESTLERVSFPTRKACLDCHGEGYDVMLDRWQALLQSARRSIADKLEQVALSEENLEPGKADFFRPFLERARYNLTFLDQGHGEHNILYAERILVAIQSDIDEAVKVLDPDAHPPDVLEFEKTTITADCTSHCHRNMEKTLTVRHQGLDLSHRDHIYKHDLQCAHCHDNDKKHGTVRLQKSQCIHCHHTQQTAECGETCHRKQATFLAGDGGMGVPLTPDPMDGEVACDECHQDLDSGHDPDAIDTACVDCHEDTYTGMAVKWQKALDSRLDALRSKVDALDGSGAAKGKASTLIKIKANIGLIEEDRSGGAHNPGFAGKLLDAAEKDLETFEQGR